VTLAEVRRNINEALTARLRMALGDYSGAQAEHTALVDLEAVFNALSDIDLSSQLNAFFNAWSDLENTPEDQAARSLVISQGQTLSESIQRLYQTLARQFEGLNEQVEATVARVNEIGAEVANLNVQIVTAEAGGQVGNSTLRDRRDLLLSELAELVAIQTREQPSGSMTVYIGNEPLVQDGIHRELTTTREFVDGRQVAVIRWADNNRQIRPWGGELEGLLRSRDTHLVSQMDRLDALAVALISDVNRVHAAGQGLEGFETLTGTTGLVDPDAALNTPDNGMPWLPTNGSFQINVTHAATGLEESVRIEVDLDGIGADTTLNTLAADITANVANLTASVTVDNRLMLEADTGFTFTFGEDTGGVLGALGLNGFFTGDSAVTIAVDDGVINSPNRVAAATSPLAGDGTNAGRIAGLASATSEYLGTGQSLLDYYNAAMTDLATTTAATKTAVDASDVIAGSLRAQWESVSGVNLDEETVQLLRYERAFQGAARVIATVDEMIQQIIALR
jgi:flagellar hook-associated protein 1